MTIIAPAITVENTSDFQKRMNTIKHFANRLHIDISDGVFAPRKLIDPHQISWASDMDVDIHIMAKNPSHYIEIIAPRKPDLIVIHTEIDEPIDKVIKQIKQHGIRAGLALLQKDTPSEYKSIIASVDHVMIFSGDLGYHNGTANLMQLRKIPQLLSINPSLEIGWDGGANTENVHAIAQAGVHVINCGGAINNTPNPQASYNELYRKANYHSQKHPAF